MTCNGSSSMASICGSTMSLMNAWVPIKAPVAWVAMWMIYDEETWNYKILAQRTVCISSYERQLT